MYSKDNKISGDENHFIYKQYFIAEKFSNGKKIRNIPVFRAMLLKTTVRKG